MLENFHYTKTEQDKLLKSITILVDTREKENSHDHILNYFESKDIPWEKFKLNTCDYSFKIPANEELGIVRDLYFNKEICIERKANLEELSKNLTAEKTRISNEFSNAPKNKVLLIENASYENLVLGKYNTSYNPKSYWASVFSMWHKYDLPFFLIQDNKFTGQFIYGYFYYYLRNIIK